MKYNISKNNEVSIYINDEDENPLLFQPGYPNGTLFETSVDAQEWAESYIQWYNGEDIYVPAFKGDTGEFLYERVSEKDQIDAAITALRSKFDPVQLKMILKEIVDSM